MAKSKAKTWCQCERPVFLLNNEGVPFSDEPMCQECRHPRKRALPPRPVQARGPAGWDTVPSGRPAELATDGARLGAALAKTERLGFIASAGAIVAGNLDANDREPERVLRRYLLERAQNAEAADPTSPEERQLVASARQAAAPPPPAPRPGAQDALARLRALRALRN